MKYIFAGLIIISGYGCNSIIKKIYGMRSPEQLSDQQIKTCSKKLELDSSRSFKINVDHFKSSLDTSKKKLKNNLSQPLQIRIYRGGSLIFWRVNCYVPGFPKLKWNHDNAFNTFPPSPSMEADTNLTFNNEISTWKSYSGNIIPTNLEKGSPKVKVVVYWVWFLKKQSKHLLKTINEYKSRYHDKEMEIYFVNCDNLFVEIGP